MSADDSMELDYGLPPTQPAFIQLSHPVVDKRTRIGWQNSQSSSQNALSSLLADVEGDALDASPVPIPLTTLPEFPVASTSASASTTHRPDRRRRRAQRSEPEPAHAPSAVLNLLERLTRTIPEQSVRYAREKQRAASSSSALSRGIPRSREASGSSTASSGPQTPDSDISRAWPAPQLEGAPTNGAAAARTRSLGSGQLASSSAAVSASIRHHSLPGMAKRLPPEHDVPMGVASDGCSMTDAFARAALDSPTAALAAWPSPVTEKSSPAPDRSSYPDTPHTSHLPPDTSVLPDTSRLIPPNLQRRSSSPAASLHRASGSTRPLSRTSSSSTAVPAHQSRDPTPQAATPAAPTGSRSLKRTGSRTLSRDDIFKAIATAPPSPVATRQASVSRQTAPPGPRPTSHAPAPSQRPKTLGMRRGIKPYGASTKRPAPQLPPPASQGYRIQNFKPPLAKKPAAAPVIPNPKRASTPPRPPPRKPIQAPTPDSSQPQPKRKVKAEAEDEKMPDVGDSSFGDLSFGIDTNTLDHVMEQYD